jgi:hypothetical protein
MYAYVCIYTHKHTHTQRLAGEKILESYVDVYMHVCIHTHKHTHRHSLSLTHTLSRAGALSHVGWLERRSLSPVRMYVYIYLRMYICMMYVCMCTHTNRHIHALHAYPHPHPRTHTHTHKHTHTCLNSICSQEANRVGMFVCLGMCVGQACVYTPTPTHTHTCLILICSRDANHLLPAPHVNSYTPVGVVVVKPHFSK